MLALGVCLCLFVCSFRRPARVLAAGLPKYVVNWIPLRFCVSSRNSQPQKLYRSFVCLFVCSFVCLFVCLFIFVCLFHSVDNMIMSCYSGDDRYRHKFVWAHKWVWAWKSRESLWTHNAPPEPEPAVRKSGGEWNKWYVLLSSNFWFFLRGHEIREIRKFKSTKANTYFTRLWFSVLRAQEGRCGFRGILPISEPTLTCGLRRICAYVDRPHCAIG